MSTLTPLFEASLRGALLIGVLALLRVPLRRLIGSPWFCALWIVVLLRLMVPGSIQSSWSMFNWWPQAQAQSVRVESQPLQARVTVLPADGIADDPVVVSSQGATQPAPSGQWLLIAWIAGASVTALMFGWRIFNTSRMAALTQPADHPSLVAAFDSIALELRGNVALRQASNLDVPALVGLWRPEIWMPESWLESMSEEDLRHVLLHELGHARRGDLWVQWAFALVQCIHWFNPMVWLAARLAHADRELACDAWVLRRAAADEPERYGATLVKAAQMLRSQWHLPPAAITMAMSKGSLFSRVQSIGQFRPIASWRAVLGSSCVAILLGSLATDRLHAQAGGGLPVAPAGEGGASPQGSAGAGLPPVAGGDEGTGFGSIGISGGASAGAPGAANAADPTMKIAQPTSPHQVEIEARFIEMKDNAWQNLGLGGLSSPAGVPEDALSNRGIIDPSALHTFLSRLPGSGGGMHLLSAPRVTTRSGQRAVIEIIREFRYANDYAPDAKAPEGLIATTFETRNTGITLEVEPNVGADGRTVDLNLQPQIVELAGFTSVRTGQPVPLKVDPSQSGFDRILNATMPTDVLVQPIFSTRKITTSISLPSGHTLVVGGLKRAADVRAADDQGVLFILITARIINHTTPGAGATPSPAAISGDASFGTILGGGAGLAPPAVGPGAPAAPPVVPGLEPAFPGMPGARPGAGIPGAGAPLPTPPPGALPQSVPAIPGLDSGGFEGIPGASPAAPKPVAPPPGGIPGFPTPPAPGGPPRTR